MHLLSAAKKRALELLSETLAKQASGLTKSKVLNALLAREKLGCTGLGKGIAIPHCRLAGIDNIHVAMLKLKEGVEFESSDDLPVKFLFCMVVPEQAAEDQLQLLAGLATLLNNNKVRQSIEKMLPCGVPLRTALPRSTGSCNVASKIEYCVGTHCSVHVKQ